MENNKEITDILGFIDNIKEGKYCDERCNIQQFKELRYDFNVVEEINSINENVLLYGLSH